MFKENTFYLMKEFFNDNNIDNIEDLKNNIIEQIKNIEDKNLLEQINKLLTNNDDKTLFDGALENTLENFNDENTLENYNGENFNEENFNDKDTLENSNEENFNDKDTLENSNEENFNDKDTLDENSYDKTLKNLFDDETLFDGALENSNDEDKSYDKTLENLLNEDTLEKIGGKDNPLNNENNIGIHKGECSYFLKRDKFCIKEEIKKIEEELKEEKLIEKDISDDTLEELKNKLNCPTEKCVANKLEHKLKKNMDKFFKPTGPTNTDLFSNINIDNVLDHYELLYPNFYHINFIMDDWYNSPKSHELLQLLEENNACGYISKNENENEYDDILNAVKYTKKNCMGFIMNTDRWSGGGKHWMACFIDMRNEKKWTIEFFNSSGNKMSKNFYKLFSKLKEKLEGCSKGADVEIIQVTDEEHQIKSDNNCGSFACFYIYSRLKGESIEKFNGIDYDLIKDELIDEFRKYIFYTIN
jgi:hypothetical protein